MNNKIRATFIQIATLQYTTISQFHFNRRQMSDDDIPKQKYQYAQLASIDPTNPESKRTNLYALIIDASFPYPIENQGKHMVILKIIDPSYNPFNTDIKTAKFAKVSIFSKDINALPRIHSHGCILRIHRAFANIFKESLQINCELPRSSWAIFKGEIDPAQMSQYSPIANSGKSFTLESSDKTIIDSIREFSLKVLTEKAIEKENCVLLKDAKTQTKDFDVICKAYGFKVKGDSYILKVCDATKTYKVHLKENQAKSLGLCSGDIIKLRGFLAKDAENIVPDKFSNILVLAPHSKAKSEFIESMKSPVYEVYLQLLAHSIIDAPKLITRIVDPKIQGLTIKSLSLSSKGEKIMKLKGFAVDIQPAEVCQWVVKYNKKSKEISLITPSSTLGENEIYAYRIQFLLKDDESAHDDKLYRVILFTGEGMGKEFLPQAVNLLAAENKDKLHKLRLLKKLFLSFNAYLELGVTMNESIMMVTGTEQTI